MDDKEKISRTMRALLSITGGEPFEVYSVGSGLKPQKPTGAAIEWRGFGTTSLSERTFADNLTRCAVTLAKWVETWHFPTP